MTDRSQSGARPGPLMDPLGQMIQQGREAAEFLWQVPEDAATRTQVGDLLTRIHAAATAQGKHEMPAICEALAPAVNAVPTPQSVEILQDGFERLHKLWLATRSGLV